MLSISNTTFDYHAFFITTEQQEAKSLEDLYEEDRQLEQEAIRLYGHKKAYYRTQYVSYPEFGYQHDAIRFQIHRQHTISKQEYTAMIELKDRKFAKRMHHLEQSSRKESKDHVKIKKLVDRLSLTQWNVLIHYYYEYYHPKLLQFLQQRKTYARSSTIAQYLYFIFERIYEQQYHQKINGQQQQNLLNALATKLLIKQKQLLISAGVLSKLENRTVKLQRMILSTATQLVPALSDRFDKQQLVKTIKHLQQQLNFSFNTTAYAGEALFVLSVLYEMRSQSVGFLPQMCKILLKDTTVAKKTAGKIYRAKKQFPLLKQFFDSLTYEKDYVFDPYN